MRLTNSSCDHGLYLMRFSAWVVKKRPRQKLLTLEDTKYLLGFTIRSVERLDLAGEVTLVAVQSRRRTSLGALCKVKFSTHTGCMHIARRHLPPYYRDVTPREQTTLTNHVVDHEVRTPYLDCNSQKFRMRVTQKRYGTGGEGAAKRMRPSSRARSARLKSRNVSTNAKHAHWRHTIYNICAGVISLPQGPWIGHFHLFVHRKNGRYYTEK